MLCYFSTSDIGLLTRSNISWKVKQLCPIGLKTATQCCSVWIPNAASRPAASRQHSCPWLHPQKSLRIHHKTSECLACSVVGDFKHAVLTWLPSRQIHSRWQDFLPVAEDCPHSCSVFLPSVVSGGSFLLCCCTSLWKYAAKITFFPP